MALLVGPLVIAGSGLLPAQVHAQAPARAVHAVAPPTSSIKIQVSTARDSVAPNGPKGPHGQTPGTEVPKFKWLLNVDDTGDPHQANGDVLCHPSSNPKFPEGCSWPSIHSQGASPVASTGDETDWNPGHALPTFDAATGRGLKPGKYLVSVIADGYQLGGAHFTVPMPEPGVVKVQLNPYPIPLATIIAKAYEDNAPIDMTYEAGAEHGIQGFHPLLTDFDGIVSTDFYGNPLCTQYKTDGAGKTIIDSRGVPQPVPGTGGQCLTDKNGEVRIPNLAPNRYAVQLVPPEGQEWIQTYTLEGNHDFDVWALADQTGHDTEMVVAGEPVPFVNIGFVRRQSFVAPPAGQPAPSGEIKGQVMGTNSYIPGIGGLPGAGGVTAGLSGLKTDRPVKQAWIGLSDMQRNDSAVFVQPANPVDGTFDVKNVPDGTYLMSVWDQPQDYLLDSFNLTIKNGQVLDLGSVPLISWFTRIEGNVFIDKNGNGRRDPGEPGVPNFLLQNLNRSNNTYEQGQNTSKTDSNGHYEFTEAYPLGQFTVNQAFNQRYKTTGITYQACNDPQEHTVATGAVDVSYLPIISQCGRLDWGVQSYNSSAGDNGGIVATIIYDELRQKYNARQAQTSDYQTGIPGVQMELLNPVLNADGSYAKNADGSYQGTPFPTPITYQSENWGRPTGCTPRDANGNVLDASVQDVMAPGGHCIESAVSGVQFGLGTDDANVHPAQTVDGNYTLTPPSPGTYIVKMTIPGDKVLPQTGGADRPLFRLTTEADVNTANTAQFIPQGADHSKLTWPPKPGPARQMPTGGVGAYQENPNTSANGPDPICTGTEQVVQVTNGDFLANGGSPFEGLKRNRCDQKLIHTQAGQSVAPNFHLFTDVPMPTKFSGLILDDVSVSTNRKSTTLGEVAGIPNAPIGIYDWAGRLIKTVDSDYNGSWEVLMPSSEVSCPTPAVFCPSVYRFVGNDPGQPGAPNGNYNPGFRTIAANFQAWPNIFSPADLAPTKRRVAIEGPPGQFNAAVLCDSKANEPQLFAINKPFLKGEVTEEFTVDGAGFGPTQGTGALRLTATNGDVAPMQITAWSDRQIKFRADGHEVDSGAYQLSITNSSQQMTVKGLTFHMLKGGYNPQLLEVGPTKKYKKIQDALEAAAKLDRALVVVYPNTPTDFTPLSAYYENIVVHSPVKVQGVGPGGVYPDGSYVLGSVIDGRFIRAATTDGGEPNLISWYSLVNSLRWDGNQTIQDGEVVYVLAKAGQFKSNFPPGLDGFSIQNGNQYDFPANIQEIGGRKTAPFPPAVVTQGGAIFLNAHADNFQITNNLVQGNSGTFGAIRVGTPQLDKQHNYNVHVAHNRVHLNGGTNLAGALGFFNDSNGYRVEQNVFCGNLSSEYGGAVSQYGYSPNGRIDHNKIYLNQSVDEGGGLFIGGELPQPNKLSKGTGPVRIDHNYIGDNLANDDGGGIRLLMAGNYKIDVINNMITNNVSLHEGGAVALDDAPQVNMVNDTIAKNLTTATAVTSNGLPAPAGVSTVKNSVVLQASLPPGSSTFSNPKLVNDVFWDNRAGSWTPSGIAGIGLQGDATPINRWDIGTADGSGLLAPTYSILNSDPNDPVQGYINDPSNKVNQDPLFVAPYDTHLTVVAQRTYFRFRPSAIVAVDLPANVLGDYHLQSQSSSAYDTGREDIAPKDDVDGNPRPGFSGQNGVDAGAHELQGPASGGAAPGAPAANPPPPGITPVAATLPGTAAGPVLAAGPSAAQPGTVALVADLIPAAGAAALGSAFGGAVAGAGAPPGAIGAQGGVGGGAAPVPRAEMAGESPPTVLAAILGQTRQPGMQAGAALAAAILVGLAGILRIRLGRRRLGAPAPVTETNDGGQQ